MMKILFILLFFAMAWGGQSKVERNLINDLRNGYKMSISNDSLIVYNDCERTAVAWSSFTKEERQGLRLIYREWKRTTKEFNRFVSDVKQEAFDDYIPPVPKIHLYFIVREARAYRLASRGIFNLDSTRIDLSRHRLDSKEIIWETYILYPDTDRVIQYSDSSAISYATWKYCTLDSLRSFINNDPAWTDTTR